MSLVHPFAVISPTFPAGSEAKLKNWWVIAKTFMLDAGDPFSKIPGFSLKLDPDGDDFEVRAVLSISLSLSPHRCCCCYRCLKITQQQGLL